MVDAIVFTCSRSGGGVRCWATFAEATGDAPHVKMLPLITDATGGVSPFQRM